MTGSRRIDTHQHLIPPRYRSRADRLGLSAGGWPLPDWDPDTALAVMDDASTATGILSLSAPGPRLTGADDDARATAREVNEYGAELVKDRPDRFGMFASLPMPDVDGCLAELARAFDELHADGVVLLTNYAGKYLGDKDFEPLWAELDARSAVVFVHPTEPPLAQLPNLPGPIVDYPFDTTRTAVQMAANGVLTRYPRMKVILSHAGGFVPFAAYRFVAAAQFADGQTPDGILTQLRSFYVDLALSSTPSALPSVTAFADPARILYGSDFPFADAQAGSRMSSFLDSYELDETTRHAIDRGNAEALFSRLA